MYLSADSKSDLQIYTLLLRKIVIRSYVFPSRKSRDIPLLHTVNQGIASINVR